MGFKSKYLHQETDNELLCMPFGITCSEDGDGWDTSIWDKISPFLSADIVQKFNDALKVKPKDAIKVAVASLENNNIWHKDLNWRHLALLPKVKQGWFSNYPMIVEPSFIDYGNAAKIDRNNVKQAKADMEAKVTELIEKISNKRQKTH